MEKLYSINEDFRNYVDAYMKSRKLKTKEEAFEHLMVKFAFLQYMGDIKNVK